MLRSYNFTGRKPIDPSRVSIVLSDRDGGRAVDATVRLDGMRLPSDARVYVEAFYKASYMRFDGGSVDRPAAIRTQPLTDIESGGRVNFRVKVVDESGEFGRILADADNLTPLEGGEAPSNRKALLPVQPADLGEVIWKLGSEPGGFVLYVNNRIPNVREVLRTDAVFFSLVYPAAVREILTRILFVEEHFDANDDSDDWRSLWLRFARDLGAGGPPRPDEDADPAEQRLEHLSWIDAAVEVFCASHRTNSRYFEVLTKEDSNG